MPVDETSQFASAVLLVAPVLHGVSTVGLEGALVSRPYLQATLEVLRYCGVKLVESRDGYRLRGEQVYRLANFATPYDASSAAYLWAAAAASGGRVTLRGISEKWPQADVKILHYLAAMGCRIRKTGSTVEVEGPVVRPIELELTESPDLLPLLGTLASLVRGESRLIGARQATGKESNRRMATVQLARRFGATVRLSHSDIRIRGSGRPQGIRILGLRDHRLVMSAAVGALGSRGTSFIGDASAVAKSFPGFWTALGELGIDSRVVGP